MSATLGIGFEGGNPDKGRAAFFLFIGQPTRDAGSVYFADVTTWKDCIDFIDRLKADFDYAEDAVFEELKERIRQRAGE